MTHYEERLAEDVATIRARVANVAADVERAAVLDLTVESSEALGAGIG